MDIMHKQVRFVLEFGAISHPVYGAISHRIRRNGHPEYGRLNERLYRTNDL
jgi:hypothetical protein